MSENISCSQAGVTNLEIPDSLGAQGVVLNGVNESGGTVTFVTESRRLHRICRFDLQFPTTNAIFRDQDRAASRFV